MGFPRYTHRMPPNTVRCDEPQLRRSLHMNSGFIGGAVFAVITIACFVTLPWSVQRYEGEAGDEAQARLAPSLTHPMGTDELGRSMLWRCLLGGAISLGIGISAAIIAVLIGVAWGAIAGLSMGRTDAIMMRTVDVLYGLPYVLLVVLIGIGLQPLVERMLGGLPADIAAAVANVATLLVAIGGLSWMTMSRVIRGQVLSLRSQPFIEAARACGVGSTGILWRHLLPNLVGPIIVYGTLAVPTAILAESTLSFLGIGVQAPLPSWGNIATEGMSELHGLAVPGRKNQWWLILWPCLLLGLTLMALNFLGDALRDRLDPRSRVNTA